MNRNFNLLIMGQSAANIGDVLYMVSIINLIFTQTGSAAAASFVPFTITSAMFLSSLLTPLLFGKVSLKWLMTGSQIGKTFSLILLGLSWSMLSGSTYGWVFLTIGLIAFLDGCANPIRQALIPHYVNPEQLLKANGLGVHYPAHSSNYVVYQQRRFIICQFKGTNLDCRCFVHPGKPLALPAG